MERLIEKYNKRIDEIIKKQKPITFGNQWLSLESERQTLTSVIVDLEREMAKRSNESAALPLHDVNNNEVAVCDNCKKLQHRIDELEGQLYSFENGTP